MQIALNYRWQHPYKLRPLEYIRYFLHSYMTSESQQGIEQPKQQPEDRHMLIFYTWTSVYLLLFVVVPLML